MSEQKLWIRFGEAVTGPFSASQARQLAEVGEITPETPVSADEKKWMPASKFRGLSFSVAERPAGRQDPATSAPATVRTSTTDSDTGAASASTANSGGRPDPADTTRAKEAVSEHSLPGRWDVAGAFRLATTCLGASVLAVMGLLLLLPHDGIAWIFRFFAASRALPDAIPRWGEFETVLLSLPMQYLVLGCLGAAIWKHRAAAKLPLRWLALAFGLTLIVVPLVVFVLRTGLGLILGILCLAAGLHRLFTRPESSRT